MRVPKHKLFQGYKNQWKQTFRNNIENTLFQHLTLWVLIMINHLEQLIALISLENDLDCETLDGLPEYYETNKHLEQFHMEMDDNIVFKVIPVGELFLIYSEENEPLAILQFDDFDLAYEELEIYATEIVNG